MSDTTAALKAAREVQADTLTPGLFREANETFEQAQREYKFKNFKEAKELADKARTLAEQAEFQALKTPGANRVAVDAPPPPEPVANSSPYPYPSREPTPVEAYDEKKRQEDEANRQNSAPSNPAPQPSPAIGFPYEKK